MAGSARPDRAPSPGWPRPHTTPGSRPGRPGSRRVRSHSLRSSPCGAPLSQGTLIPRRSSRRRQPRPHSKLRMDWRRSNPSLRRVLVDEGWGNAGYGPAAGGALVAVTVARLPSDTFGRLYSLRVLRCPKVDRRRRRLPPTAAGPANLRRPPATTGDHRRPPPLAAHLPLPPGSTAASKGRPPPKAVSRGPADPAGWWHRRRSTSHRRLASPPDRRGRRHREAFHWYRGTGMRPVARPAWSPRPGRCRR